MGTGNFDGFCIGAVKTRQGWVGLRWRGNALVASTFFENSIQDALTEIEKRSGMGDANRKPPKWVEDFFTAYADGKFEKSAKILADKAEFEFLNASEFRRRVWDELTRIPTGSTLAYGDIARSLHNAPRAVGGACGANPCVIIIPCHRVIASDGGIGGFGGDTDLKRRLLKHEGCIIN
jgi:O-6-methylguanine DNA methyltransferase